MGRNGEADPEGGDAVSVLELMLKLLDGMLKLVSIAAGMNSLLTAWKKHRQRKKNHRE
ncbi:hypothetical protein Q5741_14510 [Paenibacillus sp. JX-17]|uniref:Uncharacterized protein n=1 Tax=Paenibacillus lacisoli TaxID=3064525 RepID=A0ABT9CEB6_9BACL|nr:hypothetical protein [Paenibacillus sp. JX-17]MDO7907619.1 hypothetical protein [Paenibacillus sp. JX-17]